MASCTLTEVAHGGVGRRHADGTLESLWEQGRALEPDGETTRGRKAERRLGQEGPREKTRPKPVLDAPAGGGAARGGALGSGLVTGWGPPGEEQAPGKMGSLRPSRFRHRGKGEG